MKPGCAAGSLTTDIWVNVLRQAFSLYDERAVDGWSIDGQDLKMLCSMRVVCKQLLAAVDLALQPPNSHSDALWLFLGNSPAASILDSTTAQQMGHVILNMWEYPAHAASFRRFFAQSQLVHATIGAASATQADAAVAASTSLESLSWHGRVPAQLPARLQRLQVTPGAGMPRDALENMLRVCVQCCPALRDIEISLSKLVPEPGEDSDSDSVLPEEQEVCLRASSLDGLQLPGLQALDLQVFTCNGELLDLSWLGQLRSFTLLLSLHEQPCTAPELRGALLLSLIDLLQPQDSLTLDLSHIMLYQLSLEEQQCLAQLQLHSFELVAPNSTDIFYLPQASNLSLSFFGRLTDSTTRVAWSALTQQGGHVDIEVAHEHLEVFGCASDTAPPFSDVWTLNVSADSIEGLPPSMSSVGHSYVLQNDAATAAGWLYI